MAPTGKNLDWTYEMRSVIHLLKVFTSFDDDNVAVIFSEVYRKRVRDDWQARDKPGRPVETWAQIRQADTTGADADIRPGLWAQIQPAVAVLGLDVTSLPAHLQPAAAAAVPAAPVAAAPATAAVVTTAPISASGTTIVPPLEMIHRNAASTVWEEETPHSLSSAFVDHNDDFYQIGGKVYRGMIDGGEQDVMVCEEEQCEECQGQEVPGTESMTDGLPFVHSGDLQRNPGRPRFAFGPVAKATATASLISLAFGS